MRNPRFLGVYSHRGRHGREGRIPSFFVWRLDNGSYAIQELDQACTPKGDILPVQAERFEAAFKLEPSILAAPIITPDFSHLVVPGQKSGFPDDATLSSLEKARQARQIEADLRDGFGRALAALSRPRDRMAAIASLQRIAAVKKGIVPQHKHMFRDFGVALRKKMLVDLALACADRAVELAPDDDHARFNLARLLGIAGRYDDAEAQLRIAIKLDPSEEVYGKLKRYLAAERLSRSGLQD